MTTAQQKDQWRTEEVDLMAQIVKATFLQLNKEARVRIEHAQQKAAYAGSQLGTSSQAMADQELTHALRSAFDDLSGFQRQEIMQKLSRCLLDPSADRLPRPDAL